MDYPNIKKGSFKGKNEMKNGRRSYITWEYNDTSLASQPEGEEQAHLSLMASHHSDDEEVNESNSFSSSELQSAFNDLHDEYMKLTKLFLKQKSELEAFRNKPSSSSCQNCFTLKEKVSSLSLELNKMNKSSKSLSKIINDQRHSIDRRGLGYSKGPALKKQNKHTPNTCSIKKYGVPLGHYIWVEKGSNHVGPKTSWENLRIACNLLYLDSSCLEHMTGDQSKFYVLTPRDKGYVTYGDTYKGRIIGVGRTGKPPSTTIEGVLYVEGLEHNLLSIIQLCDKGFHVSFYPDKCIIESKESLNSKLIGKRINNIHMIDIDSSHPITCLVVNDNHDAWLWCDTQNLKSLNYSISPRNLT
ncbi:hypothetical protein Lal_00025996 [Lupinus albus]|nr:hypothetical protein Lal_00025996 [Lupinus albus]